MLQRLCFCLSALLLNTAVLSSVVADAPLGLPREAVLCSDLQIEHGKVWKHDKQLFLELDQLPADGWVNLPRICNVVEKITWLGSDAEESLALKPEITYWRLQASHYEAGKPMILVLQLDAELQLFTDKLVVEPDAAGVVFLAARFARTTGDKLRFEPQPFKNTVGYWVNEQETAQWSFNVDRDRTYTVEVYQGCGTGQGGSDAAVKIGDQTLTFVVEDTGHFQNFKWRKLGDIKLSPGETSLVIAPQKKAKAAVMEVRAVRLTPQK